MPTEKEVLESHQAEQILKSDVFKTAIDNLKQEYIEHWMQSNGPEEGMHRESIHKSICFYQRSNVICESLLRKGNSPKQILTR